MQTLLHASAQEGVKDGFKPVGVDGPEMQSGERLLVEAYAAIWLIALVFVLILWRRTRALEGRIEALAEAIRAAAGQGAAAKKVEPAAKKASKPAAEDD